jgi:hypothetical protein
VVPWSQGTDLHGDLRPGPESSQGHWNLKQPTTMSYVLLGFYLRVMNKFKLPLILVLHWSIVIDLISYKRCSSFAPMLGCMLYACTGLLVKITSIIIEVSAHWVLSKMLTVFEYGIHHWHYLARGFLRYIIQHYTLIIRCGRSWLIWQTKQPDQRGIEKKGTERGGIEKEQEECLINKLVFVLHDNPSLPLRSHIYLPRITHIHGLGPH